MRQAKRLPLEELAPYLLAPPESPSHLNWLQVFGNDQPVELEVGFGKGLFLLNACQACPDVNFLGIEILRKYQLYAATRFAKRGLKNVRLVKADAREFLRHYVSDESFQAIHVYFPDPWWKARHKKRRVLNEAFLRDVERTLVVGGRLHFWTDVEEYFRTTLELIAATVKLVGPVKVDEKPAEHDLDYRTHFERRTRKNEEPVYRAEFVKEN